MSGIAEFVGRLPGPIRALMPARGAVLPPAAPCARPSARLFGRVLDGRGDPVDGLGPLGGLAPAALACRTPARPRASLRVRPDLDDARAFRPGARVALREAWPAAGRRLARMAETWRGPIVAALVGGSIFEHSVFSADLGAAFYRAVIISEPCGVGPFLALCACRVATGLASRLAAEAGGALLLVGWRLAARPAPADATASHDVTAIWTIEGEAADFDLEIGPGASGERAA